MAGIIGELFPVSHAPKRPRYGSKQVGFGLVISGGVLERENLSAHVQVVEVMQLWGPQPALYQPAQR